MYLPTFDAPTKRLRRLELVPLQLRRFQLVAPSAADRSWLRDTLDRECRRFGHGIAASGEWLALAH